VKRVSGLVTVLVSFCLTLPSFAFPGDWHLGPGNRIHGSDISSWQHPHGEPIDFEKMYESGIRFVFIKGMDTKPSSDKVTLRFLQTDRAAAQRAGLYTGMYHHVQLPALSDRERVRKNAIVQADKFIRRANALGAFNELDMPLALDLESNCVSMSRSGVCRKYLPRPLVTEWAVTWLQYVESMTERKPIVYSYPQFLEDAMVRDERLNGFPLWLAHYALDPSVIENRPNAKTGGCFAHSWTSIECTAQWLFWQYSSCGAGHKYGVPSARLDLNVFNGSREEFLSIVNGSWRARRFVPFPRNQPTVVQLIRVHSGFAGTMVAMDVKASEPDGTAVLTGTVTFKSTDNPVRTKSQRAVRLDDGSWRVEVIGLREGVNSGTVTYKDVSGSYRGSSIRVSFTVSPSLELAPEPTRSPKSPADDSCRDPTDN
jgi:lysozyme